MNDDDIAIPAAGDADTDMARSANRLARRHTLLRERFIALERRYATTLADAEDPRLADLRDRLRDAVA